MILKTLHLKNFRKFKDSFIEFPDGVTGIVGLNGVGKSTVFEAVAWVLYGPVATRTATNQIKREGAAPSDPCRVEIEFLFDGDAYRVVREMSGKTLAASGTVTLNGKIAAQGAEVITKFLQKKLGMDWKSFYTSIFAKQKELNSLSSMNPSERRQLILRMLGINAVDEIINTIRSDTKEKKSAVERIDAELIDDLGQEKKALLSEQKQVFEKKYNQLHQRLDTQKTQRQTIEESLKKSKRDFESQKLAYEEIVMMKEQLEEKKSKFEQKQRIEEDKRTLEKTIGERSQHLKEQLKKLTLYKNVERDLKVLEEKQDNNHDALQECVKHQQQTSTLRTRLKQDIAELTTKKQRIDTMGPDAKCPTCERQLGTQHNTLLQKYLGEIGQKNLEAQKLDEQTKHLSMQYEQLTKQKQALQKKYHYLRTQIVDYERLQTTCHHINEEIQKEKQTLSTKQKELKAIGRIEYDVKQYSSLRTQINKVYTSYQTALEKLNTIQEKYQHINLVIKEQEMEKKLLIQQQQTLTENIEHLQNLAQKQEQQRTEAAHLSMLSEVMDAYRSYLISQIRPALSLHASELFTLLTDGKYSEIELDDDYNLLVYDHGQPYSIERFSGGEEDLANLCIRLAISEIITERAGSVFQFIILDEIFGSQDAIRKQNIIKALNSFSSKFRQIFLITHVEDIKHFTEHTLAVEEDDTGTSSVTLQ